MITLCLLAVIALLTGMLIIEGNATDRQEKRADLMTDLYNKSVSNNKKLQAELETSYAYLREFAPVTPIVEVKPAKKRLKKKTAGRPKAP